MESRRKDRTEPQVSVFVMAGHAVNTIITYFFKVVKFFTCLIHFFTPSQKSIPLPPIKSDLLKLSATQLAKKLKQKELKSIEVVETYISRIKEVNPIINSLVQDRFDEALKEAKKADLLIGESVDLEKLFKERPLLGVPISVKETVAVKGMSNNGARSRVESRIAESDAEVVVWFKAAGAIPMVVTNTPELCLYFETCNPKIGRTLNPYDTRRTSGGSSGGEAALISAAGSVIGIGSDIAGSIRIPAFFCGIFGHKPTPGYVSISGHIPSSDDPNWKDFFTLGPLARYAEDLPLMMEIMTAKDRVERLRLNEPVDLSKIKIYYMYGEGSESKLQNPPNFQVKKTIKDTVDILVNEFHCTSEKVDIRCVRNSLLLTSMLVRLKGIENVQQYDDDHPDDWGLFRALQIVVKKLTFQSNASCSLVLWGLLKWVIGMLPSAFEEKAKAKRAYCNKVLSELLSDNAVLIYPTFPWEAPYHDTMSYMVMDLSYCTLFTITGLPVSQVPVRTNDEGLPLGVQVVAAPHQDRLCFAVAQAIEKCKGGWTPPPESK